MPELQIKINNRIASYEGQGIVAENEDYVLSFVFDEDWSSLPLYARFVWNKYYWDEEIKDGKAAIPHVKNGTNLFVGVLAGDDISTTAAEIPVFYSIKRDDTVGHPERPTDAGATKSYVDEEIAEVRAYVDDEFAKINEQLAGITVDKIPTLGSFNPVSSDGVYSWVPQIAEEIASQHIENLIASADDAPQADSEKLVKSGGVYEALDNLKLNYSPEYQELWIGSSPKNSIVFSFDVNDKDFASVKGVNDTIENVVHDLGTPNHTDDIPTEGSNNWVKSGGVYSWTIPLVRDTISQQI